LGEAGGLNLYGYVGNNPINRVDPLGLSFWGDVGDAEYNFYSSIGNFFTGSQNSGPAQDPNSIGALSQNAGYGFHPLYDEDGNALGNPASAVGGAVVGGVVDAASMFTGGGEAKMVKCEAKSIWSSTKAKTAVENAFGHWEKHKGEFPEFQNAKQYVEGAKNFFESPPPGTLTKINSYGDKLFYNPASNTFGVQSANGAPRTLFRPTDGINYWNRQ
jgi:uncharacterized protein RhaS with RHS repeats